MTEHSVTMQVEKTSRKQNIANGLRTIPRSSILSLRIGNRRVRGRVIGTLVGFLGVGAVAGEAMQGGWGIAALGAGIAGHLAGWAFDKATHEIHVEPGPDPSPALAPLPVPEIRDPEPSAP